MARKEPVLDFEQSRKRVADYFGCDGDFFFETSFGSGMGD